MTPKSYFDTAIVVMEEVGPLLQLLRVAKGLSPDRNQAYSSNDFPAAVQNQINVITEITCKSDFNGGYQLHEVLFCASTTGALMNCSYNATNGYIAKECPGKIFFPHEPEAPLAPTLVISTPPFYIALTFARAIYAPLFYIALFYIALAFALAISVSLFYIALMFVLIISAPLFYTALTFALVIYAPRFYIALVFVFYVIVRLM
ncbi:uncharacterized protein LOC131304137 [Rhododendron vialii]|uniref:uncharacterized protein LOC131304137 n=1 Tax=Rhododendron vialii TaxID=182163 RepID=UPI00265FFD44|nr:uncharacterized protein LOC131304137 [Rhododendron vialii]